MVLNEKIEVYRIKTKLATTKIAIVDIFVVDFLPYNPIQFLYLTVLRT